MNAVAPRGEGRIPEAVLEEIRARLPIEAVVSRHVVLKKAGRWMTGLCPFHAEKTPSFSVRSDTRNFHCFGCGAHGDVVGFLQRIEGLPFREAVARAAAEAGVDLGPALRDGGGRAPWSRPAPVVAAPRQVPDGEDDAARTRTAFGMWLRGVRIAEGGPVASYLAGRGLWPLPEPCHAVLREARLRHRNTADALHPVMIARVDGPDGTFAAVHRTYLAQRPDGGWGKLSGVGDPKLSYGPIGRGAIRLFPAAPRLGLAEGIETALAAHLLSGRGVPVWACLSAGGLEQVVIPFDVDAVVVFADRDKVKGAHKEGRGARAGRALAARLSREAAVRVEVRAPVAPHGDYADVLAARLAQGAEAVVA